MKKMISIIIFLLIIIFCIWLYVTYKIEKYTGVIIRLENDIVTIKAKEQEAIMAYINEEDRELIGLYCCSTKGVPIKDGRGNKLESSNLKIGDNINIFRIKDSKNKIQKAILRITEVLTNVKLIEVIDIN